MHVLHLIRDPNDATALETLHRQARDPGTRVSVVLMHDAVSLIAPLPGEALCLDEGRGTRSARPVITPARLLELIFAADRVVLW